MKREREEEENQGHVAITVRYGQDNDLEICEFRKPDKFVVSAIQYKFVDLEIFDLYVQGKNIPYVGLIREALATLPKFFRHGTVLTGICMGANTVFLVQQKDSFGVLQRGKWVSWEDIIITQWDLFKVGVLPLLSYKDILALETTNFALRKHIINSDIWQVLFARDFPEIYNPEIFSYYLLVVMRGLGAQDAYHIALLKRIAKQGARAGFQDFAAFNEKFDVSEHPTLLWKLLYEYWRTYKPGAVENAFIRTTNRHDPNDRIETCAFYRGKVMTLNYRGQPGFTIGYPGSKYHMELFYDSNDKNRKNRRLNQSAKDFFAWKDANYRDGETLIASFEFNERYVLMRLMNTVGGQKVYTRRICDYRTEEPLLMKYSKKKEVWMALLGPTGYVFSQIDPNYPVYGLRLGSEKKRRHVIVDHTRNLRLELDNKFSVWCDHATPSECFLLHNENTGTCQWRKLAPAPKTLDGPVITDLSQGSSLVIPNIDIPITRETAFYIFSNKWLAHPVGDTNNICIWSANHPEREEYLMSDVPMGRGCIVGNDLYVIAQGTLLIVNMEKIFTKAPGVHVRRFALEGLGVANFDYMRMTFLGPVFCFYDPHKEPKMLVVDKKKFELVSCQVCQISVESMCSLCETPACSEAHLRCCIEEHTLFTGN